MVRSSFLSSLLLLAVTSPLAAHADTWDKTFPAEEVGTWLPENAAVVVVAAGEPRDSAAEVAAALINGLRKSGRLRLVADPSALGNIGELDDGEIVSRAQRLPIDFTAVVRTFPGRRENEMTAIVLLYDRDGESAGAYSAERGTPVESSTPAPRADEGVGAAAAEAVSSITKAKSRSASEAEEAYELSYLWFKDYLVVDAHSGARLSSGAIIYQGKYQEPVHGRRFYEIIEREDLSRQFEQRQRNRMLLMGSGAVLALGGLAVPLLAPYPSDIDSFGTRMRLYSIGAGASLVGGGLFAVGLFLYNPHPITLSEARRLADEYNKDLKQQLGLAASQEPSRRRATQVALSLSSDSAALTIGRQF